MLRKAFQDAGKKIEASESAEPADSVLFEQGNILITRISNQCAAIGEVLDLRDPKSKLGDEESSTDFVARNTRRMRFKGAIR